VRRHERRARASERRGRCLGGGNLRGGHALQPPVELLLAVPAWAAFVAAAAAACRRRCRWVLVQIHVRTTRAAPSRCGSGGGLPWLQHSHVPPAHQPMLQAWPGKPVKSAGSSPPVCRDGRASPAVAVPSLSASSASWPSCPDMLTCGGGAATVAVKAPHGTRRYINGGARLLCSGQSMRRHGGRAERGGRAGRALAGARVRSRPGLHAALGGLLALPGARRGGGQRNRAAAAAAAAPGARGPGSVPAAGRRPRARERRRPRRDRRCAAGHACQHTPRPLHPGAVNDCNSHANTTVHVEIYRARSNWRLPKQPERAPSTPQGTLAWP